MIKLTVILKEIFYQDNQIWYHGSPSGDLRGSHYGLHLGTYKAAKQALEAKIGIPAEGEWDGTREYGKTLLMGKKRIPDLHVTGYNCYAPDEDYYPNALKPPTYSDGSVMSFSSKPSIKAYKIICPMTNTPQRPYEDFKANGYMAASIKRGNAKRGFYYRNESEDYGSISVVVPNGNCVKEV